MTEIVPIQLPELPLSTCKVCGLAAHGVHFGVTACRACAAFFRRFVVLNLDYECLQDENKCSLDRIRRNSCRHCRYKKCLQVGMTTENVQWNRDTYSSEFGYRKLRSQQVHERYQEMSRPSTSSAIRKEDQLFTQSILDDVRYENIEQEINRLFLIENPSIEQGYFSSLNTLDQMVHGIRELRVSQRAHDIKFHNRLSLETLIPHWREQAVNIAKLSMHSTAFRKIPLSEKKRLFKSLWQNLYRFERIQMSTEIFGESCVSEKKLAISCQKAIQLDALFFDIEGVAKKKLRLTLQDYKMFAERCVNEVAKPLSQMKLSEEEVAFLIVNFVVHNEESIFGKTLEVHDEFRDKVADGLHEYYRKNNIMNYASRITKMMRIIVSMKRIHYDDLGGSFTVHSKNAKAERMQ